jgi:hypothetical protein
MTNTAEIFERTGCVQVNQFIDVETISTISQYFENKIKREEWKTDAVDGVTKLAYYADPLIEVILLKSTAAIEQVCGKELLPTYSYSRIYQPGEDLAPHTDRSSCEVSVTINVANTGEISPIYMQYADNPESMHLLNPGDAVVYKGCEAKHWRLPMKDGQLNVQFMLHYVDKNGPYASYVKDTRPSYAAPSKTRQRS